MALIVPEESQRPYRFGMTLVCIGALFNWLGLADHQTKEVKAVPAVRYIGVGLVASGAVLICMAMCFWMNSVRDEEDDESIDHIHVISLEPPVRMDEKPPDYASVVDLPPPSYDDAIKLDPQRLIMTADAAAAAGGDLHRAAQVVSVADTCAITIDESCDKLSSTATAAVPTTGDAVDGPAAAAQQQTSTSTTLAQAIRKSIRDIRKQLTNTVSDADAEHQPHAQSGCSATHNSSNVVVVVAAPSARNKTSNAQSENAPTE